MVNMVNTDDCWHFAGAITKFGYGMVYEKGVGQQVHRVMYTSTIGEIPKGLQIDHLCRVRHCCNPMHLQPVTPRENTLRGTNPAAINKRKTHCNRGHAYDSENTIYYKKGRHRVCRICITAWYKKRAERQKLTKLG